MVFLWYFAKRPSPRELSDQKLEKNPLMVMSEESERAEIFALLRDCVRNVYVSFNRPENQKLMKKLYCERAEICGIFGSETYDSPQYSVDKSHGLSYNKLCPCVRNTRDMVLFMMIYSNQKNRLSSLIIRPPGSATVLALLKMKVSEPTILNKWQRELKLSHSF